MPTTKKRLNISLNEELAEFIKLLAERDGVPQATKVVEILKDAIEEEMDQVLAMMAEERDTKTAKFISHDEAWQ